MFIVSQGRYFKIKLPTQEGEINYVIYCTDAELLKKATGELTNDGY